MAKTTSPSPKPRKLTSVPAAPLAPDREQRIAARAYQLAEQRGFTPGREMDDWLAAEQEIDGQLTKS